MNKQLKSTLIAVSLVVTLSRFAPVQAHETVSAVQDKAPVVQQLHSVVSRIRPVNLRVRPVNLGVRPVQMRTARIVYLSARQHAEVTKRIVVY
jgi:hypothetical protein